MMKTGLLSAERKGDVTHFTVWAPLRKTMWLHLVHPFEKKLEMAKSEEGYWRLPVAGLPAEARYFFRPDDEADLPDPASGYQPQGVHGPSQVVDQSAFQWTDDGWKGLPLEDLILYEIHVGTFTPEGSFDAIIPRLDVLRETGINALELMPVAQFPGDRNWGYDGVFPYAVQNSYGGPEGLKRLVDACHQRGIAVILDVVYNHLGPEGNHFSSFGPYFTEHYRTPWGDAINFDGAWSDGVRAFFSNNPVFWLEHYHIDGLRCDAIHAVYDFGAMHFWELLYHKLREKEKELGRPFYLMAESDTNSPKVVKTPAEGGYGFAAQWLDDFHHALYVLLNAEDKNRYYDFGSLSQLAKAYKEGFVHSGQWVEFRKRHHGVSSAGTGGNKFIAFIQNHDQVGNRVNGERLCMLVDLERVKLAAAAVLLSPYIPLLFMGEEYADDSPFFYFVSHTDPALVEAVRKGRKEEFKDYGFTSDPPDAQAEDTFLKAKLHWEKRTQAHHRLVCRWYTDLIRLRRESTALRNFSKDDVTAEVMNNQGLLLRRQSRDRKEIILCLFNLSPQPLRFVTPKEMDAATKLLDSADPKWSLNGREQTPLPAQLSPGEEIALRPYGVVVYRRMNK